MTLIKTLILLTALAVPVASCGPQAANNDCAGWRPVYVDDATVDYLNARDPEALREILAHHEAGQARGCW